MLQFFWPTGVQPSECLIHSHTVQLCIVLVAFFFFVITVVIQYLLLSFLRHAVLICATNCMIALYKSFIEITHYVNTFLLLKQESLANANVKRATAVHV